MNKATYEAKRANLMNELQAIVDGEDLAGFEAKEKEIKDLDIEFENFAKAQANSNALSNNGRMDPTMTKVLNGGSFSLDDTKLTDMSNQFSKGEAIKVAASGLNFLNAMNVPLTTHVPDSLNRTFNEVSNIVDLVKQIPLNGGESYKSPFVVSSGTADYTAEGVDYHDNTGVVTDFSTIGKSKITTYFELPEEVQRLGGQQYMSFALEAAQTAVRKKIGQQIISGTGGAETLTGILNAAVNVIPANTDLSFTEINNQTLDTIVFSHGGDESVEGGAYLVLNKKTLAEFSKLRATDGKRIYKIELDKNGNSGKISSEDSLSVPFVINSNFKSFNDALDTEFFALYGKPQAYELATFSDLELQESTQFKFKSGMIAIRASIFVGGNVSSYKGFTRIKKTVVV